MHLPCKWRRSEPTPASACDAHARLDLRARVVDLARSVDASGEACAVALLLGRLDLLNDYKHPLDALERPVRLARKMMFVSSAKAERELGWRTVPVDGALRRSVE